MRWCLLWWALRHVVAAPELESPGSIVLAHGLSCRQACGLFLDQGLNSCPLPWQADSSAPSHQESPQLALRKAPSSLHPRRNTQPLQRLCVPSTALPKASRPITTGLCRAIDLFSASISSFVCSPLTLHILHPKRPL